MSFFTDASFVMDPNVYGVGKLYVPKPTDGSGDLTFSRASTGTRVNQDGLIEKVRTNLLLQSNTFNTTWTNTNTTETSGQAGYDGTNNAWLLDKSAASGFIEQSISLSGLATYSVYVKAGTATWVRLLAFVSGFSTDGSAYINLSNGTVGVTSNLISTKVDSIGNGWYRVSIVPLNSPIASVRIYPAEANSTAAASGNILIQNAQLEVGDIATDYIPTTTSAVSVGPLANIPRLNYGSDGCPSLLLEPQRTNLVTFSESFENSSWIKRSGLIVTSNYGISPDGYQNADRVQKGTSTDGFIYKSFTFSVSTVHTISVYAKGTGTFVFNIYDGTSGYISNSYVLSSSWQRFNFTFTTNSTTASGHYGLQVSDDAELWGAQIEAGSYATSYIPTLSTSVTRLADTASKTGISSLIGQSEGTLFFEGTAEIGCEVCNLNRSTTNSVWIYTRGAGEVAAFIYADGAGINLISGVVASNRFKAAVAYKSNSIAFYVNGNLIAQNTTATFTPNLTMDRFDIGIGGYVATKQSSTTNQALIFKTRLSNADLARLTSL